MESKNLRRKIFENVSKGLVGIALFGLTACATVSKQEYQISDKKTESVKESVIYDRDAEDKIQDELHLRDLEKKGYKIPSNIKRIKIEGDDVSKKTTKIYSGTRGLNVETEKRKETPEPVIYYGKDIKIEINPNCQNHSLLESCPAKVDTELTSNNFYHIFDEKGNKTGIYMEEGLYGRLSKDKKDGEYVKIPGLEKLNIKAGQGEIRAFFNNLGSGGRYLPVYSGKKVLEEFYVAESTVRLLCDKKGSLADFKQKQDYDGRFVKIPGTSLELRCILFDEVESNGAGGGGGPGGAGGAGGSGAGGGGQGGGGGGSGGGR